MYGLGEPKACACQDPLSDTLLPGIYGGDNYFAYTFELGTIVMDDSVHHLTDEKLEVEGCSTMLRVVSM